MSAGDTNSPVIDYTSLDYSSMLRDLEAYAQRQFSTELWTDFNSSQFAQYLAQMMAYATDLVAYQQNACILETLVDTVIREKNFRKIAKTFSFSMASASPSVCQECRIYNLNTDPAKWPLTLYNIESFVTSNGVIFQPYATSTHITPSSEIIVPVVQGETKLYVAGGSPYLGPVETGTGLPGQRVALPDSPLIDGTLSVSVNAIPHTKITNWVEAGPTDASYIIETNENLTTYIVFGDGINGRIPAVGESIEAIFDVGGGSYTNFPAGTQLTVSNNTGLAGTEPLVGASAEFLVASTGGGDRQTLIGAKRALPAVIKANDRAVTDEDYAALALGVTGVFKASARSGIPIGGSTPVLIFVVPQGLGNPTSALANQIITAIKPKRMSGKRVYIKNPNYVYMLIEADQYLARDAPKYVTRQLLIDVIAATYSSSQVDFGSSFGIQSLYEATGPEEIEGTSRVYYRKFTVYPHYGRYVNLPTNGNGTIESITPDWPTVQRREWNVEVLAPDTLNGIFCSRFNVYQRMLGTVSTLTDDVVTDDTAGFRVNDLIGWNLHALPEELSSYYSWPVIANTDQSVTVGSGPGGLLTYLQPDDQYAIEKLEATKGKILRSTTTWDITASTLAFVDSSLSWAASDKVRIIDTDGVESENTVASVVSQAEVLADVGAESTDLLPYWDVSTPATFTLSGGTYALGVGGDVLTLTVGGVIQNVDFTGDNGQTAYVNKLNATLVGATAAPLGPNIVLTTTAVGLGVAATGSIDTLDGALNVKLHNIAIGPFANLTTLAKDGVVFDPGGVRSLKVTANGSITPRAINSATLVVGYRYTISGKFRGDGASGIPRVVCGGTSVAVGTNVANFQAFSVEFVATATTIQFGADMVSGSVWFDGMSLIRMPALVLGTAVTAPAPATLDYIWPSADGTIQFAVVNGSTEFTPGDKLYVDTYAAASDLILRKEDFPVLEIDDIIVNTVGGV